MRLFKSFGSNSVRSAVLCLAVLSGVLFATPKSFAQWTNTAPGLMGLVTENGGAMCYRDGILWVANSTLVRSPDLGNSWTPVTLPNTIMSPIIDISFFDKNTGIFTTVLDGVWMTNDQGANWNQILKIAATNARFGSSTKEIFVTEAFRTAGARVYVSQDGGMSWNSVSIGRAFMPGLCVEPVGDVFVLAGTAPNAAVYVSTDRGLTWNSRAGRVDFDSYTLAIDSCSKERMYVANEDAASPANLASELYVTSNGGVSWSVTASQTIPFYTGSIALAKHTVYVQSVAKGLYRSTDFGSNWSSIGGPSAPYDTKLIAAIDDNIVFAVDPNGSVWRTTNSGGDSLKITRRTHTIIATPATAFAADTLSACDPTMIDTIYLRGTTCDSRSLVSLSLLVVGATHYKILSQPVSALKGNDTITLSFSGGIDTAYPASLEIVQDDGTRDTITLLGNGRPHTAVKLNMTGGANDTIGGTIYVPILAETDVAIIDLECVLHYDTAILIYGGTFDVRGRSIDVPSSFWLGRTKVHIDGATVQSKFSTIAYALFRIFPTHDSCSRVRLDSIVVKAAPTACATLETDSLSAELCAKLGCGTTILSDRVRYGVMPNLTLQPNPATHEVLLESNANLGEGSIEIVDALGRLCLQKQVTLSNHSPIKISTEVLPSGEYFVRVKTATMSASLPLHIIR
jgi:photosystem II stability/assembly factor-like uncharacterized protein